MTSGIETSEPHDRKRSPVPEAMRYLGITVITSALLATLFTAWSPASLDPREVVGRILDFAIGTDPTEGAPGIAEATQGPQFQRVGIIAGHSGPHPDTGLIDPGATCDDGLTELEINQAIADLVVQNLEADDVIVDRLDEFDDKLIGYRASVLVSIHSDACFYINDQATGYKVTRAVESAVPDLSQRLATCVIDRYERATNLRFHRGSITQDMTQYHTFYEIHNQTPAVIIETGFLYLDREFLSKEPEKAAKGISDGILCFLNNEPANVLGEIQ